MTRRTQLGRVVLVLTGKHSEPGLVEYASRVTRVALAARPPVNHL